MAPQTQITLLVVDESPAVRQFVELAVGSERVRVAGAVDGYAALHAVGQAVPTVALIAAGTLGPGGVALESCLSALNVPVVLMTGSLNQISPDAGAAAGVLAKPLQVEQLRDLVSRLDAHRAPTAPAPVPIPASIPVTAEMLPEDVDPVDSWLRDADAMFGPAPSRWRRLAGEGDALHSFARDLASFRSGPAPEGLRIHRHRSMPRSTARSVRP